MIIAVAGERFGHILSMYDEISQIETSNNLFVDWVIQLGSLGAFADRVRFSKALKQANTPDDFQKIYAGQVNVSKPTLAINGIHDDHNWLYYRMMNDSLELAYNLSFLVNGFKTCIGDDISLVGLGKTFSPTTWARGIQTTKDLKHYTRREVERACSLGPVDLLVTHEPPYNTKFRSRVSKAEGISKVAFATQPKLIVSKSYDQDFHDGVLLTSKYLAVPAYRIAVFDITKDQVKRLA